MRTLGIQMCVLACFVIIPCLLHADNPPSRAGMIASVKGTVRFAPSGADTEGGEVTQNATVTSGNHFWTTDDSTLRIEIGATTIYLGARTKIAFINLSDTGVAIALHQGDLYIQVKDLPATETFEIAGRGAQFRLMTAGTYRMRAEESTLSTELNVRAGSANLLGVPGAPLLVLPRQLGRVQGNNGRVVSGTEPDQFETSCNLPDPPPAETPIPIPATITGASQVRSTGRVIQDPELGSVWQPTDVSTTWAPYQDGKWAFVEPWGWTWVDNASWGFAPFHYGRWTHRNYGWAWIPPAGDAVYAPALVAFVDNRNEGFELGAGSPAVAWFALGPGEVYTPAYSADAVYWSRVNRSNTVIKGRVDFEKISTKGGGGISTGGFHQKYSNQNIPSAVTAVTPASFTSGESIRAKRISVSAKDAHSAKVVGMTAVVTPTRESYFQSAAIRPRGPESRMDQPVVFGGPTPGTPLSFAQKQNALSVNGGRPLGTATLDAIRRTVPTRSTPYVSAGPQGRPVSTVPARNPAANPSIQQPVTRNPAMNPSIQQPVTRNPALDRPARTVPTGREITNAPRTYSPPARANVPSIRQQTPAPVQRPVVKPQPQSQIQRPAPAATPRGNNAPAKAAPPRQAAPPPKLAPAPKS